MKRQKHLISDSPETSVLTQGKQKYKTYTMNKKTDK